MTVPLLCNPAPWKALKQMSQIHRPQGRIPLLQLKKRVQPSLSELTSNLSLPLKALSRVAEQGGFSRSCRQFGRGAQRRARRGGRPTPPVPRRLARSPRERAGRGCGWRGRGAGRACSAGRGPPPSPPPCPGPAAGTGSTISAGAGTSGRARRRWRWRARRSALPCGSAPRRWTAPGPRRDAQGSAAGAPRAAAPSPAGLALQGWAAARCSSGWRSRCRCCRCWRAGCTASRNPRAKVSAFGNAIAPRWAKFCRV